MVIIYVTEISPLHIAISAVLFTRLQSSRSSHESRDYQPSAITAADSVLGRVCVSVFVCNHFVNELSKKLFDGSLQYLQYILLTFYSGND